MVWFGMPPPLFWTCCSFSPSCACFGLFDADSYPDPGPIHVSIKIREAWNYWNTLVKKMNEKNDASDGNRTREPRALRMSVGHSSLPALKIRKCFVSTSRALKRMMFILAGIPIRLLCNDLWSFHGEFWFSHRENRKNGTLASHFLISPLIRPKLFIF